MSSPVSGVRSDAAGRLPFDDRSGPGVARGPAAASPTLGVMDRLPRRDAYVLLAVLGTGVFLAGLELMITAVALPAIVVDLADWTRLREASWIINGYLLVYVVTMPLAGRLADLWGNRRMFLAALALFTVGQPARRHGPDARAAHRRAPRPGRGRRHPRAGGDVRGLAPVRRHGPAARAGRHRRADVPGDGGRPGAGRRDPRRVPPGGRALAPGRRARVDARRRARARRGAGCSTSTSRSASSRSWSRGRRAPTGRRRDARAASTSSVRCCSRRSSSARSGR